MKTEIISEREELHTPLEARDFMGLDVAAEFDYITEDEYFTPRLFKVQDTWYDALDFMIYNGEGEWDGYLPDTFFSRIVIRFLDDEIFDDDGFIRVGLELS